MSGNTMECSNCGTVNEASRDTCVQCGQPLTASADEGLRTQVAAQEHGSVLAPAREFAPAVEPAMAGTFAAPALVDADPLNEEEVPQQHEGRPLRRS